MQKYWRRCWFFCSADATTGIQNTNCQIAQAGVRRKPFSGIRRKWMRSRRFPKKAPEKPQAFRKNVRHRRQHRKKRCRFISAVRSLPPVSTRWMPSPLPRRSKKFSRRKTFPSSVRRSVTSTASRRAARIFCDPCGRRRRC